VIKTDEQFYGINHLSLAGWPFGHNFVSDDHRTFSFRFLECLLISHSGDLFFYLIFSKTDISIAVTFCSNILLTFVTVSLHVHNSY